MNQERILLVAVSLAFLVGFGRAVGQEVGSFQTVDVTPGGDVAMEFEAPASTMWRLETSEDLEAWEGWVTLRSTGINHQLDTAAVSKDQRFFRAVAVADGDTIPGDHVPTANGDLVIHPVNHASFVMGWNGLAIYVDPVGGGALYQTLPKADLILVTHQHGDHLHAPTIESVRGPAAVILAPQTVFGGLPASLKSLSTVLTNGTSTNLHGLTVEALPAYNLTTSNHPRGVGNSYVITLGGKRVYVSGDTEDIPEMRALRDIDVAFVCMNVPYTMPVTKASSAVREFRPRIVYPYHYRNQDGSFANLEAFKNQIGTDLGIEVRQRGWY